jgi:Na+-driven multidrug efflux pump
VQLVPAALIRMFAGDPALTAVGGRALRICLLAFPVVGFQVVGANFFQAIGKARTALVLTLLRQLIVLLPLLLVLPRVLGLDGVWAAGPVSDVVAALLTGGALIHQMRVLAREESRVES